MSAESEKHERARWWPFLLVVFCVLYVAWLFYPLWWSPLTGGPRYFIEGDVAEEYGPDLRYLCRGLWNGGIPRWNPHEHGGRPFYADPQAAVYHPLNWGLCALAGGDAGHGSADLRVVLFFLAGSLGAAVFLRGEGASRRAALLAALLFPLTPYQRHNWELNLTWSFSFLPWVLWALRRIARDPSVANASALALSMASVALIGSPPSLFYVVVLAVPFGLHVVLDARKQGVSLRRLGVMIAVAALLCFALVAPMLSAAWELTKLSVRSSPSFEAMAAEGLRRNNITGLLLRDMNDHFYVGWLVLLLASIALSRSVPETHRLRGRWLWFGIAVVGAILMLGANAPLFRLWYELVPGAKLFRNPTRYSVLLGTASMFLAAAGVDAIRWISPRGLLLRAGIFVVVPALFVLRPSLDPWTDGRGTGTSAFVALGGGAVLWWLHKRGSEAKERWAASALLLFLAVFDLRSLLFEQRHCRPEPMPERTTVLQAFRENGGFSLATRTWDEFALHMRPGMRHGFREFRGFEDPLELSRYSKLIGEFGAHPELLPALNVGWILRGSHYLHGTSHHYLPVSLQVPWLEERAENVFRVRNPMPLATWVDGATVVADADEALTRFVNSVRAPGPESPVYVFLERGTIASARVSPGTGAWRPAAVQFERERLQITVDAPSDGWLLVREAYYPGWRATMEGQEIPVLRANSWARAVPVRAGRHSIEMVFRPWQPRVFEPLALLALMVSVGTLVQAARSKDHKKDT